MKNSFKNALNALGLLVFMGLAWATSKDTPIEPIKMEVKINADSTAFLLKNLEDFDCTNGGISLLVDSVGVNIFFGVDSITVKTKAIDTLPFNKFIRTNNLTTRDTFSKRRKVKLFTYTISPHPTVKKASGEFSFGF
jgi:hypothetical protein